jgi:uncharacterized membrane protein YjgN (DUF898 family)
MFMDQETAESKGAFEFTGDWREYAPIAFTNLLLSIVTLGVYSFWARTRTRRYLWSHTRFIDERLEWTGTGKELLIGYIMAFFLVIVPLGLSNLIVQGVVMRGHAGLGGLILVLLYFFILYLTGVAVFRAIRYRLSRTFWHGIRGGSDEQGLGYGFASLWRSLVGALVLGLMVPWSMTTRWNLRWEAMSFGPHHFQANARWGPLFGRYLLVYLIPIVLFVGLFAFSIFMGTHPMMPGASPPVAVMLGFLIFIFGFYIVLGVVAISYYAAYYREAIGTLSLGPLEFAFNARTIDWFKLVLGNLALTFFTLGVGYIFVAYRNWAFFIRHIEAYGDLHLDALTQSSTRAPGQGEGLLDAFDIGAF